MTTIKNLLPQHSLLIILTVSLALFMESVDTTIINTAIPTMSLSFNINPIDLKIALISYLVSLAVFIPISGWVADKYGVKRVFIAALIIFVAASTWCGFAANLLHLVIARILQGFGGSLMAPIARLIIVRNFHRNELVNVMSQVIIVAALGMMLGPVLGGFISHNFSWRWIFWVNIPVGLANIWLAYHSLKDTPPITVHPLDKLGFILFGSALAIFTFGLSMLSETLISQVYAFSLLGIATGLFVIYYYHSRNQQHPIINTQLFAIRTFRISVIGNLLARLSFGGVPFLLPLLLQIGLGYSAQTAGLLLAPIAAGVMILKPFSSAILQLLGYKRLLIINTILVGLILCSYTLVNEQTSMSTIIFITFCYGFFIAMQYTGMNSLAYADVPPELLSACTSIMSTIQQLSQSFGVAISALLIYYYSYHIDHSITLSANIFHHVFVTMGVMTMASISIFLTLQDNDGTQMLLKKANE